MGLIPPQVRSRRWQVTHVAVTVASESQPLYKDEKGEMLEITMRQTVLITRLSQCDQRLGHSL